MYFSLICVFPSNSDLAPISEFLIQTRSEGRREGGRDKVTERERGRERERESDTQTHGHTHNTQ